MKAKLSLLLAVLLAAGSLTGCLAGINSLSGGAGEDAAAAEDLDQNAIDNVTDDVTDGVANETGDDGVKRKAPVARIRVNDATGALVHETKLEALDSTTVPVVFNAGSTTFSGSDSTPLDGAKIESYEWSLTPGPILASGRTVTIDLSKPGAYTVVLTVKDNHNLTDTQTLLLHVMPVPFTTTETFSGSIAAGASGMGVPENPSHPFTLLATKEDGAGLQVLGVKVSLTPKGATASAEDMALGVSGPDGFAEEADDASGGGTETLKFGALAAGDYTATAMLFAGAAAEYDLIVEITYVEIAEGLGGGDGHGHAH